MIRTIGNEAIRNFISSRFRSKSDTHIKNKRNLPRIKSISQFSSTYLFNKSSSSAIALSQYRQQRQIISSYSNTTFHHSSHKIQSMNSNTILNLLPFSRGVFVSTASVNVITLKFCF